MQLILDSWEEFSRSSIDLKRNTERCAIVNCTITNWCKMQVGIVADTFLIQDNGDTKKLLHAFNVPIYPQTRTMQPLERFTLVFEGVDPGCKSFQLLEGFSDGDGFHIRDITRQVQAFTNSQ